MTDKLAADIASDLRAIHQLHATLERTTSVALTALLAEVGPVAHMDDWQYMVDRGKASEADEDPDELWPAQQFIHFWADSWRKERGYATDRRPSFNQQIKFLGASLGWARDNEPHLEAMSRDMRTAKAKLENLLHAGMRAAFTGVPCMYDECGGVRLRRDVEGHGWSSELKRPNYILTDWYCPKCDRTWDEDTYARMVVAAAANANEVEIDGQRWVTPERAATLTGRRPHGIRTLIKRGKIAVAVLLTTRRQIVSVQEIDDTPRHGRLQDRTPLV